MPCSEFRFGDQVMHLCQSNGETRRVPNVRRKRWWCFKCRKRALHTLMCFYPDEPSYYDPSPRWECPTCHEEQVLFPGQEWQYD